jgi:hypothetical protein
MCPSSPSDAFTFTELGVKEISSTAKVFANDKWNAGIREEVERLCAMTGVGVAVREISDILV